MFIPFYVEHLGVEKLCLGISSAPAVAAGKFTIKQSQYVVGETEVDLKPQYGGAPASPMYLLLAAKPEDESGGYIIFADAATCRFKRLLDHCLLCGAPK